ncbi:MAG: AAA family ATPase [Clostridiales bacterium]|nr:AAA family ATPase [Clostridiales bacterium]
MNDKWKILLEAVPKPPEWKIKWDVIMQTPLAPYLNQMSNTQQNPEWHREGDVLTHTKMGCGQLTQDIEFRSLHKEIRETLFTAALMHDLGKIPCTRLEEGVWKSPRHTIEGAKMTRNILWNEFSLFGTKEEQETRECICNLIRFHSVPSHIAEQANPEVRLHKIAAQGELIPCFSLYLLSVLVRADIRGRLCDILEKPLKSAELCFSLAKAENIFYSPGRFPSEAAKQAYLSGKIIRKDQDVNDDTWGEAVMVSGFSGSGKDLWIKEHYSRIPVISLDSIGNEMNISPEDNQSEVMLKEREMARGFLRNKQSFVWSDANLTSSVRRKQLSLFEKYNARTKIVFLETPLEINKAMNVSEKNIFINITENFELPERTEARFVEWRCL